MRDAYCPTTYETFLEILRDAWEAWGNGRGGIGTQRTTPFHVLFAELEHEKTKRAHWGDERNQATANTDLHAAKVNR